MIKYLSTIAVIAAIALGVSIFGTVVNTRQTAQNTSLTHQVQVEQHEIAKLEHELDASRP